MRKVLLPLLIGAAAIGLSACNNSEGGNGATPEGAQTGEAKKAAGDKTIASGIDQNGKFFQAAKAAGLDATLAGPGPYTVLIPDDAAFAKLPAETSQNLTRPEARAQVTTLVTYHILPGTVLVEDIRKTIDNADGKAVMMTVGGNTFTATRDGDKIVLTDGNGGKATITQADQQFTNGVVHHIDAVLTPESKAEAPPAG